MSAQEEEWTAIVVLCAEYGRWPTVIMHTDKAKLERYCSSSFNWVIKSLRFWVLRVNCIFDNCVVCIHVCMPVFRNA